VVHIAYFAIVDLKTSYSQNLGNRHISRRYSSFHVERKRNTKRRSQEMRSDTATKLAGFWQFVGRDFEVFCSADQRYWLGKETRQNGIKNGQKRKTARASLKSACDTHLQIKNTQDRSTCLSFLFSKTFNSI
jgi:hypothetical protein